MTDPQQSESLEAETSPASSALSLSARLGAPVMRLMVVAFLVDFGVACLSIGVQWRAIDMGASAMVCGLLGTVSSAAYAIVCFFSGGLSDTWGRRRPAVIACSVSATVWLALLLTKNPYQLLALMPLSGAALALLWPSLQAWLAEFSGGSRHRLNRTISLFNICWTSGIALGPLAGGLLSGQPYLLFLLPAAVTYLSIWALYATPSAVKDGDAVPQLDTKVHPDKIRVFLFLAWIGNFASWYCRGTVSAMFPKLGDELLFSHLTVGVLVFTISAAQVFAFGLARLSHRWHYHLRALIGAEIVGIVGMLMAGLTSNQYVFALAFILSGCCAGVTYVSSLMYSLEGAVQSRGKRSGLHEAVLGSGSVIGPLLGGVIGETLGLHATFAACAAVFGLAIIAQLLYSSYNRHLWNPASS
ncbi:MAG: MFS transporter [Armatimonadia bacterium]